MAEYLLGIDAGTTSFKLALFTEEGSMVHMVREEYRLLTPQAGWVEHPAEEYWELLCRLLKRLLEESGVKRERISALAVSSQGETLFCLDEEGKPLMDAIVWLDNRAETEAEELRSRFGKQAVYERSGQADVTATWPASKIRWLWRHRRQIFEKTAHFLLLEDYLLYRLTGRLVCEENLWASTLLYDINGECWWKEMLDYLEIRESQLPEMVGCGVFVGRVSGEASVQTGLSTETMAVTGALDQTCGSIGAGKIFPGEVTETTGSCLAVSACTDHFIPYDEDRPVTCQNHAVKGRYTILLWSQTAGMVLKWYGECFYRQNGPEKSGISKGMDMPEDISMPEGTDRENGNVYELMDREAEEVPPGSEGLLMLPHLSGAGNPEYNPRAKGVFYGMTLAHGRKHFSRAILEAVAYMLRRNVEHIQDLGQEITGIYSMGGGAVSHVWCQIKADVTGKRLETIPEKECACKGAAILAGVGAGIYADIDSGARRISGRGKCCYPREENRKAYDMAYETYLRLYDVLEKGFWMYTADRLDLQ